MRGKQTPSKLPVHIDLMLGLVARSVAFEVKGTPDRFVNTGFVGHFCSVLHHRLDSAQIRIRLEPIQKSLSASPTWKILLRNYVNGRAPSRKGTSSRAFVWGEVEVKRCTPFYRNEPTRWNRGREAVLGA